MFNTFDPGEEKEEEKKEEPAAAGESAPEGNAQSDGAGALVD